MALGARGGTTSAQVRKDLSFFGSFGKRGLGYGVHELARRLREILGLGRRYRVVLIGEDLGTVSPNVREALHRYGVLSYKLLYFERHGDGSFRRPEEYPELALCATTTHDLPTLAGFWTGQDIQARVEAGVFAEPHMEHEARRSRAEEKQRLLDAFHAAHLLPGDFPRNAVDVPELVPELHYAAVGYLASTPSTLFLMNQEDLTKELEQQNLPGTTWQHPNWSRKTRFLLEELAEDPLVSGCTRMLADWLRRTGRIWPRT